MPGQAGNLPFFVTAGYRHEVEFGSRDLGIAVHRTKKEFHHVRAEDAQQVVKVNGRGIRQGLDHVEMVLHEIPGHVVNTETLRHASDQAMGLLVGCHTLDQQADSPVRQGLGTNSRFQIRRAALACTAVSKCIPSHVCGPYQGQSAGFWAGTEKWLDPVPHDRSSSRRAANGGTGQQGVVAHDFV